MDRKLFATVKSLEEIGITELYLIESRSEKIGKKLLLEELFKKLSTEGKCVLYEGSSGYVFGDGNPDSPVVFVGEAPGEEEDRQKKPFVGRAGRYLNEKLQEVGLSREEVYITNVVKSRPPGNRKPTKDEMIGCIPYLRKEIEIIKPKLIVCLGSTALEGLLGKNLPITRYRGQVFDYPYDRNIKVFLTYHPAYVLRNPQADKEFTQDIKKVVELLKEL
ncbi:uracil-DNA glycosylase [Hydrogenobacter hydrogenophilus]|uniref:Type-4 uracil-DNA glycosylase n=1 Tax=Hydrogenobacter hydrogenophilus TaxID=35835 RepID=A0A285NPB7_9AQUI|nr:uracil-DNA glycosylase [Hydrogenobacter hydrogenophilus]SNZ11370.1 DNA polymerase [Hydrogenobacter hydrogenophilus]